MHSLGRLGQGRGGIRKDGLIYSSASNIVKETKNKLTKAVPFSKTDKRCFIEILSAYKQLL
jgi:hypothetical protein